MKARCWISYGQGGEFADDVLTASKGGIDRLASRIKLLGVECDVQEYYDSLEIYKEAKEMPEDTVLIMGGASLGANEAPLNASYLYPRKIDYIFGIQPSLMGRKNPIPSNVIKARCFVTPLWAPTSLYWFLGAYAWTRAMHNNRTELIVNRTFAPHPGSNSEPVQTAILEDIGHILLNERST